MNHKLYTYLPTRCRNVSTLSIILPIPSSRLPLEFTTTRVECWRLTNDFVTPLNTVPNVSAMVEKRGIHNYGEINVLCLEYLNKGINCTWLINKWMKHFIHLDIMKRYSNNASFQVNMAAIFQKYSNSGTADAIDFSRKFSKTPACKVRIWRYARKIQLHTAPHE